MLAIILLAACSTVDRAPVRATMADGQILMGNVTTQTLRLESALGLLPIPLDAIGEVEPVEGGDLSSSSEHVRVWLRNGSELVGKWKDPQLTIDIEIGQAPVAVDLPINDLARFQTTGAEMWPSGDVFRVRTALGDDFLIDAATTTIVVENDLGSFAPTLSECTKAQPVGDPAGIWEIQLQTGTLLKGDLRDSNITFSLPLGPQTVTVPLELLVSMEREQWGPQPPQPPGRPTGLVQSKPEAFKAHQEVAPATLDEVQATVAAPADDRGGWFDSSGLRAKKAQL